MSNSTMLKVMTWHPQSFNTALSDVYCKVICNFFIRASIAKTIFGFLDLSFLIFLDLHRNQLCTFNSYMRLLTRRCISMFDITYAQKNVHRCFVYLTCAVHYSSHMQLILSEFGAYNLFFFKKFQTVFSGPICSQTLEVISCKYVDSLCNTFVHLSWSMWSS